MRPTFQLSYNGRPALLALAVFLSACGGGGGSNDDDDDTPPLTDPKCAISGGDGVSFDPEQEPCQNLSSYRFFTGEMRLQQPNDRVVPYDLATPLFSDYAHKQRFAYIPDGMTAGYSESDHLDFPVGTALIKTFSYYADMRDHSTPQQLLETRLIVRKASGWVALPYIWNLEQTEAELKVAGGPVEAAWTHYDGSEKSLTWRVPNTNQCKQCHETRAGTITPIGPKTRHLNKDFPYEDGTENQIAYWTRNGFLTGAPDPEDAPRDAVFDDPSSGTIEQRARAYLEVNCAHCHSSTGPARTTGFELTADITNPTKLGICKSPVAAGRGAGGFHYDVVPGQPDESIVTFRMDSVDPGIMMPELGRQMVHAEGNAVVREWISSLEGDCAIEP